MKTQGHWLHGSCHPSSDIGEVLTLMWSLAFVTRLPSFVLVEIFV